MTDIGSSISQNLVRANLNNKTLQNVVSTFLSFKIQGSKNGWKWKTTTLILHCIFLYISIFIPAIRNGELGEYYSNIIYSIINFPTTLLVDMWGYYASIGIALGMMLFIGANLILIISSTWIASKAIDYVRYLKVIMWVFGNLVLILSPLIINVLVGFYNCSNNINETTLERLLYRYNEISCVDSQNTIVIVLTVVCLAILFALVAFNRLIVSDMNSLDRVPFCSSFPVHILTLDIINYLGVLLIFSIPFEYKIVSDSLNIVMSLVFAGVTLYFKTCYNKIDNSLLFAVAGARLGVSIGSLVSTILKGNEFYLQVVGLPSTFGLAIIFFIIFLVAMEIYQRLLIKYVKKTLLNGIDVHSADKKTVLSCIDVACQTLMQDNGGRGYVSRLSFFLSQYHRSKNEQYAGELTEKELILLTAKTLINKNMRDTNCLFNIAMVLAHADDDEGVNIDKSIDILYHVIRYSKNYFMVSLCLYKSMELQEHRLNVSSSNTSDLSEDGAINQLKYNQDMLLSLHRDFWKELIEDSPQFSTIEKISNKIADITIECNQMFEELLGNKRSRKILRLYATYVELFLFDKIKSDALYEEANRLEKESRGLHQPIKKPRKQSQIVPVSQQPVFDPSESELFSEAPISEMDEEEEHEMQKELLFRNGIRNKPNESFRNSLFFMFMLILFCIGIGGAGFSVYIGNSIRVGVVNLNSACLTEEVGMSVIRNIKSMQSAINYYINYGSYWKNMYDNLPTETFQEYVQNYILRVKMDRNVLNDLILLAQKGIFDAPTYTAYGAGLYSAFIPTISENGQYSGALQTRRISVNEFTNNLYKFLERIEESFPFSDLLQLSNPKISVSTRDQLTRSILNSTYMNSIQDYNFMYYWSNRDNAFDVLSSFCSNYVASSQSSTTSLISDFQIYFITASLSIVPIALCFVIVVLYRQHYLKRFIKTIKKEIPKERIAKIYQSLCKQSSVDSSLNFGLVSKITKARYTLIVSVIVLILINPFCLGMFYNEINGNAVSALKTYYNIQAGARVIYYVQNCGFYLSQLLSIYGLGSTNNVGSSNIANPFFRTSESFEGLTQTLLDQIDGLSSNYTDLIFGNINIPYDTPLVGIYPSMDKTLKLFLDSSNCTDYLKANNLTYNVQNYYSYCIGVEYMMSEFVSTSSKVSELTKNFLKYQASNFTIQEISTLFFEHYITQAKSYPLSLKLASFMQEFARVSSQISYVSVLLFTVLGGCVFMFCCKLILTIMDSNSNQYYQTKMLLNYISVDFIENNDKLKNLALYNLYSDPLSGRLSPKTGSQADSGQGSYSGVCSVINSTVDGSIIINKEGEVELINTPALNMLGLSTQDILGTSFYSIFEEGKTKESVKKSIGAMVNEFSGNDTASHDSLESECLRKNGTKFPTKLNLFTVKVTGKGVLIIVTIKDITSEKKQQALLEEEKKHSENLLKNILPESVAHRLKKGDTFIAEALADVSVFFSDMVGFTKISSGLAPVDLVRMLNTVINGFDDLTEKFQLEKIKTIGDAYFAVGGVGNTQSDHPERTLKFAMGTFDVIHNFNLRNPQTQINIRIGINTGSVVAGVIGTKKFAYDLWGDAVNTASRMESTSLAGRIQITRSTYERVHDLGFVFEERNIEVKGKGMTKCYLLNDKHHTKPLPTSEELTEFLGESSNASPSTTNSIDKKEEEVHNRRRGRSIITSQEAALIRLSQQSQQ